jgi:transcriptional regulator with XRE-family HTH domain
MSDRKGRLLIELLNPEYRDTYAEQHVNSLLATQISTIRQQRGLSQTKLAEAIGAYQSTISRIENVTYAKWNIATLRRVAAALGCWLDIRLESWGKLVEDASNYTAESLRREVIEKDPIFLGSEAIGEIPEPVRWVQAKVFPWLDKGKDTNQLKRWLLGSDFPPVGDSMPAFVWIARAVAVEPRDSRFRTILVDRVLELWTSLDRDVHNQQAMEDLYIGIFNLLASFPTEKAWKIIKPLYKKGPEVLEKLPVASHSAFVSALIRNQWDRSLERDWFATLRSGSHAWLPANEFDAFEGIKRMTATPRLDAIAKALPAMYSLRYTRDEFQELMVELMEGLKHDFGDQTFLADVLAAWAVECEWYEPIVAAFSQVFGTENEIRRAILNGAGENERPVVMDAFHSFPVQEGSAAAISQMLTEVSA